MFLLNLPEDRYTEFLGQDDTKIGVFAPLLVNMGAGLSIAEPPPPVKRAAGFSGRVELDASKPDGTPLKLMNTRRLDAAGWKPTVGLEQGLELAYKDFLHHCAKRQDRTPAA